MRRIALSLVSKRPVCSTIDAMISSQSTSCSLWLPPSNRTKVAPAAALKVMVAQTDINPRLHSQARVPSASRSWPLIAPTLTERQLATLCTLPKLWRAHWAVSCSSTGRLIDWSAARRARSLARHMIHSGYTAR
jgi:hypothetical protein